MILKKKKKIARDGHLIYCFGDCNRRFEKVESSNSGSGDGLVKEMWLEIYNRKV